MRLISFSDWNAFIGCLDGLLDTPQVQTMRSLPHHPGVNCYEHSVFVAYVAFRLARRWGLDHRACALRNASELTDLSKLERNIILAHMWPLALHLPRSREAWVVSLADKLCATAEVVQLFRRMKLRAVLAA